MDQKVRHPVTACGSLWDGSPAPLRRLVLKSGRPAGSQPQGQEAWRLGCNWKSGWLALIGGLAVMLMVVVQHARCSEGFTDSRLETNESARYANTETFDAYMYTCSLCCPPHHHQQWRLLSPASTKVGSLPSAAHPPLWNPL